MTELVAVVCNGPLGASDAELPFHYREIVDRTFGRGASTLDETVEGVDVLAGVAKEEFGIGR